MADGRRRHESSSRTFSEIMELADARMEVRTLEMLISIKTITAALAPQIVQREELEELEFKLRSAKYQLRILEIETAESNFTEEIGRISEDILSIALIQEPALPEEDDGILEPSAAGETMPTIVVDPPVKVEDELESALGDVEEDSFGRNQCNSAPQVFAETPERGQFPFSISAFGTSGVDALQEITDEPSQLTSIRGDVEVRTEVPDEVQEKLEPDSVTMDDDDNDEIWFDSPDKFESDLFTNCDGDAKAKTDDDDGDVAVFPPMSPTAAVDAPSQPPTPEKQSHSGAVQLFEDRPEKTKATGCRIPVLCDAAPLVHNEVGALPVFNQMPEEDGIRLEMPAERMWFVAHNDDGNAPWDPGGRFGRIVLYDKSPKVTGTSGNLSAEWEASKLREEDRSGRVEYRLLGERPQRRSSRSEIFSGLEVLRAWDVLVSSFEGGTNFTLHSQILDLISAKTKMLHVLKFCGGIRYNEIGSLDVGSPENGDSVLSITFEAYDFDSLILTDEKEVLYGVIFASDKTLEWNVAQNCRALKSVGRQSLQGNSSGCLAITFEERTDLNDEDSMLTPVLSKSIEYYYNGNKASGFNACEKSQEVTTGQKIRVALDLVEIGCDGFGTRLKEFNDWKFLKILLAMTKKSVKSWVEVATGFKGGTISVSIISEVGILVKFLNLRERADAYNVFVEGSMLPNWYLEDFPVNTSLAALSEYGKMLLPSTAIIQLEVGASAEQSLPPTMVDKAWLRCLFHILEGKDVFRGKDLS